MLHQTNFNRKARNLKPTKIFFVSLTIRDFWGKTYPTLWPTNYSTPTPTFAAGILREQAVSVWQSQMFAKYFFFTQVLSKSKFGLFAAYRSPLRQHGGMKQKTTPIFSPGKMSCLFRSEWIFLSRCQQIYKCFAGRNFQAKWLLTGIELSDYLIIMCIIDKKYEYTAAYTVHGVIMTAPLLHFFSF